MIATLLSDLLPWAIGIVLTVLGIWGYGRSKKKEGREETYIETRARDHENASEIRSRVDRDLDQQLREHDDAGYRD